MELAYTENVLRLYVKRNKLPKHKEQRLVKNIELINDYAMQLPGSAIKLTQDDLHFISRPNSYDMMLDTVQELVKIDSTADKLDYSTFGSEAFIIDKRIVKSNLRKTFMNLRSLVAIHDRFLNKDSRYAANFYNILAYQNEGVQTGTFGGSWM